MSQSLAEQRNLFFVDTHTHMHMKPHDHVSAAQGFSDARNLQPLGVGRFLNVSTKLGEEFEEIQQLLDAHDDVFASIGLHPLSVQALHQTHGLISLVDTLKMHLMNNKVIALGETGLDDQHDNISQQREYMEAHMSVAATTHLALPYADRQSSNALKASMYQPAVIIHSRGQVEDDIYDLIHQYKSKVRGVLHCFTGSKKLAFAAVDCGYKVSFSGILTFKNAEHVREVCRSLPLDALVIETDAPYLAPHPHRGRPNTVSYLLKTAEEMSRIKNITLHELAEMTTANAFDLFPAMKYPLKS